MPIMFNSLLNSVGIDPKKVRLLRHQDHSADKDRTPYLLWRNDYGKFVAYQSRQSVKAKLLASAEFWAAFVVTPLGETLFAGLYKVGGHRPGRPGTPSVTRRGAFEPDGDIEFDLEKDARLEEYEGKLCISWGQGNLSWVQYAHSHDKPLQALHPKEPEPEFPGYLRLVMMLSEVPKIYPSWRKRLREAKGIYALTSTKDKALYIGSATGVDGFYGRWCQHAQKGGDAKGFKKRDPHEYQVSILEVAGSNFSDSDTLRAEYLWMEKLQTQKMGLNGGLLEEGK